MSKKNFGSKNLCSEIKIDPVIEAIPTTANLKKNLCKNNSNSVTDMLDFVNIAKRVEALEISLQKMASLMQSTIKSQKKSDPICKESKNAPTSNAKSCINRNKEEESKTEEKYVKITLIDCEGLNSKTSNKDKATEVHKKSIDCSEKLKDPAKENKTSKPCFADFSTTTQTNSNQSSTKQKTNENKSSNVADLQKLEKQLTDQNEKTKLINENHLKLQQKVCDIQKSMVEMQQKIKDIVFANEQNDHDIYEVSTNLKGLCSKICSLDADMKVIQNDSEGFKKRFQRIEDTCECLSKNKANITYVDENDACLMKNVTCEMKKYVTTCDFNKVCDGIRLKMSSFEENLGKLRDNIEKSLLCVKLEVDSKMEKNELAKYKECISGHFEDFVKELKCVICKMPKSKSKCNESKCNVTSGVVKKNVGAKGGPCNPCDPCENITPEIKKLCTAVKRCKTQINKCPKPKCDTSKAKKKCSIYKRAIKPLRPEERCGYSNGYSMNFPPPQGYCTLDMNGNICQMNPMNCLPNWN